jgi:hypothetical protein
MKGFLVSKREYFKSILLAVANMAILLFNLMPAMVQELNEVSCVPALQLFYL